MKYIHTFERFLIEALDIQDKVKNLIDDPNFRGLHTSSISESKSNKDDYRGTHTAPRKEGLNTLDNPTDMFGDDIYSSQAWDYFGHGDKIMDKQSANIISRFKGKPDADVTIYRAVPRGVKKIKAGDWVTINRNYAKMHGEAYLRDGFDIIEKTVKAKDIATDANSIHEWGYSPQ